MQLLLSISCGNKAHLCNGLCIAVQQSICTDDGAYRHTGQLQDAMGKEGDDATIDDAGSSGSPAGDDDFDQYLRELNTAEEGTTTHHEDEIAKNADADGASTPDTLDEYVKDLQ